MLFLFLQLLDHFFSLLEALLELYNYLLTSCQLLVQLTGLDNFVLRKLLLEAKRKNIKPEILIISFSPDIKRSRRKLILSFLGTARLGHFFVYCNTSLSYHLKKKQLLALFKLDCLWNMHSLSQIDEHETGKLNRK